MTRFIEDETQNILRRIAEKQADLMGKFPIRPQAADQVDHALVGISRRITIPQEQPPGTVICQIVLWIGKSTVVFRRVLMLDKKEIAEYWFGQLKGLLLFAGTAVLGKWIISQLFQGYSWLSFIVNGGILVLLSAGMVSLFYCRTSGFAYMMGLIRTIAGRFGKGGE